MKKKLWAWLSRHNRWLPTPLAIKAWNIEREQLMSRTREALRESDDVESLRQLEEIERRRGY